MVNSMGTEIVASLEGMKVVVTTLCECELHEYNFVENAWNKVEETKWPLSCALAAKWLEGWNAVDRFKAFSLLTAPIPE